MAKAKLDTRTRREQIAEAALRLVADQGLRCLSVAAVARRVGLVPSGLYRHFKSKDDILAAVLDRLEQRLLDNVAAACQQNADPLECLNGILTRHILFIREGRAIPRIIFSDDVHAGNPRRKRRVFAIFSRYAGAVADVVRQGQSQGRIRAELDPQTVAMMIFGIVVPAGILWHLTEGTFDVTEHAQKAWQLLCLAVQPATPANRSAKPRAKRPRARRGRVARTASRARTAS